MSSSLSSLFCSYSFTHLLSYSFHVSVSIFYTYSSFGMFDNVVCRNACYTWSVCLSVCISIRIQQFENRSKDLKKETHYRVNVFPKICRRILTLVRIRRQISVRRSPCSDFWKYFERFSNCCMRMDIQTDRQTKCNRHFDKLHYQTCRKKNMYKN